MDREKILDEAKKCVCGGREQDYGKPEDNFSLIAELWSVYLSEVFGDSSDEFGIYHLGAHDVAIMMALLKIARIARGGGSGDSYVDLAGYAACAGEIAWKEADQIEDNA